MDRGSAMRDEVTGIRELLQVAGRRVALAGALRSLTVLQVLHLEGSRISGDTRLAHSLGGQHGGSVEPGGRKLGGFRRAAVGYEGWAVWYGMNRQARMMM